MAPTLHTISVQIGVGVASRGLVVRFLVVSVWVISLSFYFARVQLCSRFGSSSSTSLAVVAVGFYSGSVSVFVSSNGGCRFGGSIVVIHSPFAVASRKFKSEALLL
ncbi:hypothetical protein TSUD_298250 [Trifolium subterraneum]|nr:hypothetical protein TSUD_298250 [Trifolium subterraneum]